MRPVLLFLNHGHTSFPALDQLRALTPLGARAMIQERIRGCNCEQMLI